MKRILFLLLVVSTFDMFGQAPPFKWVKKIPFEIVGQCSDSDDNVYISGAFSDTVTFENILLTGNNYSSDLIIAKFDSTGSLLWYKQFGGPDDDGPVDMEIDQNGNLIATTFYNRSTIYYGDTIVAGANSHGAIIVKLSNNGDLVWYKIPGYNDNGCFHAYSSAIDQDNNILILGNIQWGNGIFPDTIIPSQGHILGYLAKYNTDGDFEWVKAFLGDVSQFSFDGSNNVLIITDSIRKYSPDGDYIWGRPVSAYLGNNNYSQLVADSLDNIYILGRFEDTVVVDGISYIANGASDIIIIKYDYSGNPLWVNTAGGPKYDNPNSIFIKNGGLFMTGGFVERIFFDQDSLTSLSPIYSSAFVSEYDLAGNLKFIKKVGSKKTCTIGSIAVSKSIYLSGNGTDTVNFDNIEMVYGPYSTGYFLTRLEGEVIHPIFYPETFEIYPNPTQRMVTVNFNPDYRNVSIEIYNSQGRLMTSIALNQYNNNIDIGSLSRGLYIVKLKAENIEISRKIEKL